VVEELLALLMSVPEETILCSCVIDIVVVPVCNDTASVSAPVLSTSMVAVRLSTVDKFTLVKVRVSVGSFVWGMVTGIAGSGVVARSDVISEAGVEATGVTLSPLAKDVECSASIVMLVGSSPVKVDK
jgi:hypothetical protein